MARPTTLQAYLEGLSADQRTAVDELRRRARAQLTGFAESFEFGMPYYRKGTAASVGFTARGKGVAIYGGDRVLAQLEGRLAGIDHGKGCVRFARSDAIDWALIDAILRTVRASAA